MKPIKRFHFPRFRVSVYSEGSTSGFPFWSVINFHHLSSIEWWLVDFSSIRTTYVCSLKVLRTELNNPLGVPGGDNRPESGPVRDPEGLNQTSFSDSFGFVHSSAFGILSSTEGRACGGQPSSR